MMHTIDAAAFQRMVIHGSASLNAQKQPINDLNVFPVPDGDTGTNMSMTINAAAADLRKAGDLTLEKASAMTASATLRGARGNSGVILSLLMRGIAKKLREGEICALKWSDFDAEAGKLAVSRTLHSDGTIGETKTYSGMRSIKLPESAAEMLRERKKTALTEWIFPNPLKPEKAVLGSAAYNRLKKILKKCGLPNIRFHDLRHTFATQAIAGGVDPKSLSHLLGHTKASFSLDRYTHVTTEMQESAAATMGSFLDKIIGKEVDGWAEEKTAREA